MDHERVFESNSNVSILWCHSWSEQRLPTPWHETTDRFWGMLRVIVLPGCPLVNGDSTRIKASSVPS